MKLLGLLLAGGQSRRMGGGDKALRELGGISLLARVIERVRPQVETLLLNADGVPGFAGPLAGILAGLDWTAAHRPDCPAILSVATDAPFLPRDLAARLVGAAVEAGADLACAASGGRAHPVFGLWPVRLREDLRRAVSEEGIRKVDRWTARHRLVTVTFADRPIDPFFNANRPEDLETAAGLLAAAS